MNSKIISLNRLQPGQKGVVAKLRTQGPMRRRLQDIGLIEGTELECTGRSPGGDPAAYLIKESLIALRDEDSREICIRLLPEVK